MIQSLAETVLGVWEESHIGDIENGESRLVLGTGRVRIKNQEWRGTVVVLDRELGDFREAHNWNVEINGAKYYITYDETEFDTVVTAKDTKMPGDLTLYRVHACGDTTNRTPVLKLFQHRLLGTSRVLPEQPF